jgi:hypothetical protein
LFILVTPPLLEDMISHLSPLGHTLSTNPHASGESISGCG